MVFRKSLQYFTKAGDHMKIKLVADSSSNVRTVAKVDYGSVPLKIIAGEHEYVDDSMLDVEKMMKGLKEHKGKSGTACPGVGDWLEAFGDADIVYGVAITSNLSGCWNAGKIAAETYMDEHPDRKVFILDSLSTGPEMELILEKYRELILSGADFEAVCAGIKDYAAKTRLLFSLESLAMLAKNGRVSAAAAAAAGILGIRVIGRASDVGTLEQMHKARGEKKALQQLLSSMKELGYRGGKVRVTHTFNPEAAEKLAEMIRTEFTASDVTVAPNHGLCAFYSEMGGLLVGFESC